MDDFDTLSSAADELLFAEEHEPALSPVRPGWKLLIVDDEEEVHVITKMVLEGLTFSGKGLTFLGAYSAAQARNPARARGCGRYSPGCGHGDRPGGA